LSGTETWDYSCHTESTQIIYRSDLFLIGDPEKCKQLCHSAKKHGMSLTKDLVELCTRKGERKSIEAANKLANAKVPAEARMAKLVELRAGNNKYIQAVTNLERRKRPMQRNNDKYDGIVL
jgi:hypothetical protein